MSTARIPNWGVQTNSELITELKEFIEKPGFTGSWDECAHPFNLAWDDDNGWHIESLAGPLTQPYKGPRIGISDFTDNVHTSSFPGWIEAGYDSDNEGLHFPELFKQDGHGMQCPNHRNLGEDLLHSRTTISETMNRLHWDSDIITTWGTYRIVSCDTGENGTILRLVPVLFNDRFEPFGFDAWRMTFTSEQLQVLLETDVRDAYDAWVAERACALGMIAAPPITYMTEDVNLGLAVQNCGEWDQVVLALPDPQHHHITDEATGDITRTMNLADEGGPNDDSWAIIHYNLDETPTILGNISRIIGDWYEHGTALNPEQSDIERLVGTHPTEWRAVWKDKRKSKRIGMAGDSRGCFHHGFVRCSACNGEVEYCFNRRVETDKFNCPHCSTDSAVIIGTLTPFITGRKTT